MEQGDQPVVLMDPILVAIDLHLETAWLGTGLGAEDIVLSADSSVMVTESRVLFRPDSYGMLQQEIDMFCPQCGTEQRRAASFVLSAGRSRRNSPRSRSDDESEDRASSSSISQPRCSAASTLAHASARRTCTFQCPTT